MSGVGAQRLRGLVPARAPRLVTVAVLVTVISFVWIGATAWNYVGEFERRLRDVHSMLNALDDLVLLRELQSDAVHMYLRDGTTAWRDRHAGSLEPAEGIFAVLGLADLRPGEVSILERVLPAYRAMIEHEQSLLQLMERGEEARARTGLAGSRYLQLDQTLSGLLRQLHDNVHSRIDVQLSAFAASSHRNLGALGLSLAALLLGWVVLYRLLRNESRARAEAEAGLLAYSEDLERQVVRRTRELSDAIGQLRASETRFRDIAESGSDWLWETDVAGRFSYVSDRFEPITGLAAAAAVGRRFDEVAVAPDADGAAAVCELNQALQGQRAFRDLHLHLQDATGSPCRWLISGTPVYDPSGGFIGYRGVGRDVTRQVEIETRAREFESRLQTLIENVPGVIFQCRACGDRLEFLFLSAGLDRVVDCGDEVDAGAALLAVLTEDSRRRLLREISDCTSEDRAFDLELEARTPGGEARWLQIRARSRDTVTAERVWEGALWDTSQRRALESQMLQDQKMRAIGQLAAGIAHEINTPAQYVGDNLSFLRGAVADLTEVLALYAELKQAAAADPALVARVETIDAALERLDWDFLAEEMPLAVDQAAEGTARIALIVAAMKEFSHPGRSEQEAADINHIVENTVTVARNEWKYVAELDADLAPDLPRVPCFPGELGQVLLNMIVNAAHALEERRESDPGHKGRIRIATRQNDSELVIEVADNGAGIPDAVRDRVFDPFFTTKPVGKGTGQGLSIAYNVIVTKHAGSIEVDSEAGEGTCFVIRLPLRGVASADQEQAA